MNINTSFNQQDRNKNYQSFKGVPKNPKFIPEPLGALGKFAGKYISTPEQKLFLATSALALQPLIDLKFAQDDKKVDSAIKSAAKAIAGGLTGVAIRAGFIYLTTNKIKFSPVKNNKLNALFLPKNAITYHLQEPALANIQLKQYSQTLGTLFAILFMTFFSNANIDVPLTSDLQDFISGIVKDDKSWIESFNDVKNARIKKTKNWFKNKKDTAVNIHSKTTQVLDVLSDEKDTKTETKK